ncbi:FMN-binding negative transcriptional regulator [Sediminicola sp. 1XM1-17]|uniref:FMN-binding negative transcriptional regulator n=1 Tax=Sediminicola sp. 1XM1-17 TaxID=3127702 RepID=UPI0030772893
MYIPAHYKNENLKEVKEFIKKNSFGILVNLVKGRPWASHIPLELDVDVDGQDILVGHISKANLQLEDLAKDQEVLCIFNGPHSYISSSWYQEEEVPTWNYIAVHVYGTLHIMDEGAVLASLHKLVDKYEQDSERPISLHDLSPNTMRQIKGIIGFQIVIKDIQAAYKLSQGRKEDHPNIIHELKKTGCPASGAIAEHMASKK